MTSNLLRTCFVIMPFRPVFDKLYDVVITKAALASGFTPIRADKIYSTEPIIKDIVNGIANSSAVIADASGRNPNVNYELGVAHTLSKPTIIISQSLKH